MCSQSEPSEDFGKIDKKVEAGFEEEVVLAGEVAEFLVVKTRQFITQRACTIEEEFSGVSQRAQEIVYNVEY